MRQSRYLSVFLGAAALLAGFAAVLGLMPARAVATRQTSGGYTHVGVASCSGSTCHGRAEATGKIVRQDELRIWQDEASPSGAHSRAWRVLVEPRGKAIARRLGIGEATTAPMCLGCHTTPAPVGARGPRFQVSDGVSCEGCHGAAGGGWLSSHYAVGASHSANVARGMVPLDNPRARAAQCLDCHFGSADPDQFVNHRIMAAGHPRISFELDLFSTLQQHHDEDADYVARKGRTNSVQVWAIGQAMALDRALSLFSNPVRGTEGMFPEFYFFDCHTCHRRISDNPTFEPTEVSNPARQIPRGVPAFNDENMIMLAAAARVVSPQLAQRFDSDSRAFHQGIATSRAAAIPAAARLRESASALSSAFARTPFRRDQVFDLIGTITSNAIEVRFTDYAGSVQAVMATDTLLSALVNSGQVSSQSAQAIRPDINAAYRAVRDPNSFDPREFQASLGRAASAIRKLR